MSRTNLRRGELIAAVSGVALLLVMFLPWFSITVGAFGPDGLTSAEQAEAARILAGSGAQLNGAEGVGFSAWQVLSLMDIFFLITGLVAIGLAVVTLASQTVSVPVAAGTATAGLGAIAVLLILIRIIVPPAPFGTAIWIFVGLIAAAGIAAGGWLSMQDETPGGAERRSADTEGFDDAY